jgi:threonyl-tRNA synthetase
LWLTPTQVAVLPITDVVLDYAQEIVNELKASGVRVELDDRNEKIGYKIRDCETRKVPYMLVVGEKEKNDRLVSVRQHKKGDQGTMKFEEFLTKILATIKTRAITV